MRKALLGAAAALIVVGACGRAASPRLSADVTSTSTSTSTHATQPPTSTATPPSRDPRQRYAATGTVLSTSTQGPKLCLGVINTSLPPQCGGLPLAGFDWDQVTGEQSQSGVTWGDAHLVGTYDGTTFTLTEPATDFDHSHVKAPPPADFTSACPRPAGGFPIADAAKNTEEARGNAVRYARRQPDIAGVWLDGEVLNLTFTGDLERHEREVRTVWGGPLCVAHHDRSAAQLSEIQRVLQSPDAKAGGVTAVVTAQEEVHNVVSAELLIADDVARHWVEARFGAGAVELRGILTPLS